MRKSVLKKVAVIGAGVSGLSIARMLADKEMEVVVFEKETSPGGLIRCERVDGVLYHCVGGHVFNSRERLVLDWFWRIFDKNSFNQCIRNAVVMLEDGSKINYPIENHLYQLPESIRSAVIDDLIQIASNGYPSVENFADFLRHRFGETLYKLYFCPYNQKIWRRSLTDVPLSWLEGKLPMPTAKEILMANIMKEREQKMVHSSFYYPKQNGSQYIADRLASSLNVIYNTRVERITRENDKWCINDELFDAVIFCGNIKELPEMLKLDNLDISDVKLLQAHGTTSVLCEVPPSDYSWVYMPSSQYESHRIICTGNFSESNAPSGMSTATLEFTNPLSKEEILAQLDKLPVSVRYISHRYTHYTYPVQTNETSKIISAVKDKMKPLNMYLLGRFAEWEYYNMDAAISAAMKLASNF
ncbi:MAG: NAD(P)-binding protein [Akkermansia sp.]|nr:NAD(P)-binding protein [Akkermansia sp.]